MDAINNAKLMSQFEQIKINMDVSDGIQWLYMDPIGRPCFSTELVDEIIASHRTLMKNQGYYMVNEEPVKVDYQVMTSMPDRPYNLGGDLELFLHRVKQRDRRTLTDYAKHCIDGLYPTSCNFHGTVTTIALVRGQALGGGFESALSSSIIVAERDARMGLPEVLFNLFPGMGAYQFLSRRLPVAEAERIIMSGKLYEAEELHEMGIVDVLAEPGEGEAAVYDFIKRNKRHQNTQLAAQKLRQLHKPVSYHELMRACHLWVDTAMQLTARDLKTMERLVNAQYRMIGGEASDGGNKLRAIA